MADFTTSKVDGNTIAAAEWNQLADIDNAIISSGQTPSTGDLNQTAKMVANYAAVSTFYTDSGAANAYVLTPIGTFKAPDAYYNGMEIRFRAGNTSTTTSTVNVNALGVKTIKLEDGTTNISTEITTGNDVVARYDGTNFRLINSKTLSGKNILINGAMGIDQRNGGAAQTITAAAALAYTVDRWYAYCTGANVTGQRVAGTAPNQYNYRFTGAASVTKIGFTQRIEAANSQHLAGTTATLSVDLANSLLTTVTWVASYANTADTFGTLASPTVTQIATGTFTVSSTLTRFNTTISIPSAATTGIQIEFSVAAQISGTWTIGRAQLEAGSVATPFEYRNIGQEELLAKRYFERLFGVATTEPVASGYSNSTTLAYGVVSHVTKRAIPSSYSVSGNNHFQIQGVFGSATSTIAAL